MVKDTQLYDLLGVKPEASEPEIKKAYKKAALKYHPDKPSGDTDKFKQISEAFDILTNEDKKKLYDQFGLEAARRGGVSPEDAGAGAGGGGGGYGANPFAGFGGAGGGGGPGGRTFHFSSGGPGGFAQFSTDDAFNIFKNFGAAGGFADEDDDLLSSIFGGGSSGSKRRRAGGGMPGGMGGMPEGMGGGMPSGMGGGMPGGMGGGMPGGMGMNVNGGSPPAQGPKPSFQIKLPVSLQDLANGTTKKMKIKRKRAHGVEEKVLQLQIKPGWKAGTKITYANEGDMQADGSLQDIVFVVEEKPDATFTRKDNDLEQSVTLTLKEALCGFERIVETIEGKRIRVSYTRPVSPGLQVRYPGHGMPISKKPGERGDLVIHIKVQFPDSLTAEQRQAIETNF